MSDLDDRNLADLAVGIGSAALRTLVASGAITRNQARDALAAAAIQGVRSLKPQRLDGGVPDDLAPTLGERLLDARDVANTREILAELMAVPASRDRIALPAPAELQRQATAHFREKRWKQALTTALTVLTLAPDAAPTLHLAGLAALNLGDRTRAASLLSRTWAVQSTRSHLAEHLGGLLLALERAADAVAVLSAVPELTVGTGAPLVKALLHLQRADDAERIFRRLVALEPANERLLSLFVGQLFTAERFADLATLRRWAHQLAPDNIDTLLMLAYAFVRLRRWAELADAVDRLADLPVGRNMALRRRHSALIIALLCEPGVPDAVRMEIYRGWNRLHLPPVPTTVPARPRERDGRPLRVGYYAGTIHKKPLVDYFLPAMVRHGEAGGFQPIVYAHTTPEDLRRSPLPERLAGAELVAVGHLSDAAMIERVRRDSLDLYVDLKGHFAGERLDVLASHPAPVTAILHGNEDTCGLDSVDFLIGDRFITPPPEARSERRLIALEGSTLCYTPPSYAPGPNPQERTGVVFGAFHQYRKIKPEALDLWTAAMRAVAGSRIVIKCHDPNSPPDSYDRLRRAFADRGIAADRLTFVGRTATHAEHFALYDTIDVMFDAFPYNGVTTTCEALWMGVPLLTLLGSRMVAAHGASFVHHAGLGWLAARDERDFVAIALRLAEDRTWRMRFRREGRMDLSQTTVFNEVLYAQRLGDGYRTMTSVAIPAAS
ncbi:O-linked N-acetylglucosamine transferase family protein [Azospirillum sp. ST 5-10]|uniref:O-linked N-acetylglucosamine transferase, SPINDLY family protein n=1 Tax=unclassified Azospirillum TaxID=2630922 RepID=UPI003F4A6348